MSAEQLMQDFLDADGATEALSEEYLLCPELEDAPLEVQSYKLDAGTYIDKKSGEEKAWVKLVLKYEVESAEARKALNRDVVIVSSRPMFLTMAGGKLDVLNNQALARTVKVLGGTTQNLSLREILEGLVGCTCEGRITHEVMGTLVDEEGNSRYNAEVTAIRSV